MEILPQRTKTRNSAFYESRYGILRVVVRHFTNHNSTLYESQLNALQSARRSYGNIKTFDRKYRELPMKVLNTSYGSSKNFLCFVTPSAARQSVQIMPPIVEVKRVESDFPHSFHLYALAPKELTNCETCESTYIRFYWGGVFRPHCFAHLNYWFTFARQKKEYLHIKTYLL